MKGQVVAAPEERKSGVSEQQKTPFFEDPPDIAEHINVRDDAPVRQDIQQEHDIEGSFGKR
jgi:hypothetical protein